VAPVIHTEVMVRRFRRPRTPTAKAATVLGLYVAVAAIAAVLPFARLPGDWTTATVTLMLVVAFVVGQQLVRYGFWAQLGGLVAAGLFVVTTGLAAHSFVLMAHGERVRATVTRTVTVHGPRGSRTYLYSLADDQGHGIDGQLVEGTPEFDTGERVDVVVDRRDWVAPKTTGEVDAATPLGIAALVGFALTVLMSVFAGHSRGSGPPPRRGPLGIWIFPPSRGSG
jgi:hypothetical protein